MHLVNDPYPGVLPEILNRSPPVSNYQSPMISQRDKVPHYPSPQVSHRSPEPHRSAMGNYERQLLEPPHRSALGTYEKPQLEYYENRYRSIDRKYSGPKINHIKENMRKVIFDDNLKAKQIKRER
jgi:hypothetical protein